MATTYARKENVAELAMGSAFPVAFLTGVAMFVVIVGGLSFWFAASSTAVELRCDRADARCEILLDGRTTRSPIALPSIQSAEIGTDRGHSLVSRRDTVALEVGSEHVLVCAEPQRRGGNATLHAIRDRIETFLGDAAQPTLRVTCQRAGTGVAEVAIVIVLLLINALAIVRRTPSAVVLRVDRAARLVQREKRFLFGSPSLETTSLERLHRIAANEVGPLKLVVLSAVFADGTRWDFEGARNAEASNHADAFTAFLDGD